MTSVLRIETITGDLREDKETPFKGTEAARASPMAMPDTSPTLEPSATPADRTDASGHDDAKELWPAPMCPWAKTRPSSDIKDRATMSSTTIAGDWTSESGLVLRSTASQTVTSPAAPTSAQASAACHPPARSWRCTMSTTSIQIQAMTRSAPMPVRTDRSERSKPTSLSQSDSLTALCAPQMWRRAAWRS